jgi:hypothetical protein
LSRSSVKPNAFGYEDIIPMSGSIFEEGGPFKIRQTAPDKHEFTVPLPQNEDGRMARECPDLRCSPGYFKVKGGTGITGGQEEAFCPYCRRVGHPQEFHTQEQIRFAKEVMLGAARDGIQRLLAKSLGLDSSGRRKFGGGLVSMEMRLEPGSKPAPRRPVEESVRRDVVCPHCGLDHSVFGLATWCADCGRDIFLTHVAGEFAVVAAMVGDVARRRELLGSRVAARDLENALEDVVSIFEAVLRSIAKRSMHSRGATAEESEKYFRKLGSGFQNVEVATRFFLDHFSVHGLAGQSPGDLELLQRIFEKRHPITHNLGVVDRKYLERARSAEKEGTEISVTEEEISAAIETAANVFAHLYRQLFPADDSALIGQKEKDQGKDALHEDQEAG